MYKNTNITIANAFSLNMLPKGDYDHTFSMIEISLEKAREMVCNCKEVKSCVGHADTARIFSTLLDTEVTPNRVAYQMDPDKRAFGSTSDMLLVGQYSGPRLPEGATQLPLGAEIRWFIVDFYWEYQPI